MLLVSFTVESYINSFAYHLSEEGGGKIGMLTLDTFDRLSTVEKWATISRFAGRHGFDRGRSPFQDLIVLFKFRNDHVHDKVVSLSRDRARDYGHKFPDPTAGTLHLGNALYAARTYWDMVDELHKHLSRDPDAFHRHYNLSPWFSEADRGTLEQLAAAYERECLTA